MVRKVAAGSWWKQSVDDMLEPRYRLHLPAEIVPATHKKAARPPRPAGGRPGGDGTYRAPRGDRDEYRRRDDGGEKDTGAPGGYRPTYGVGRGGPRE